MTILDRYVLRGFVVASAFATLALTSIIVVIDMMERLDKFLDLNVPAYVIAQFYIVMVPSYLELLVPIALLLAGLFSVGRLTTLNEITAMRAGGRSTLRLILPILGFSALVSFGQVYFNGWVVPRAATVRFNIEREYLASDAGRTTVSNVNFRETPTLNVTIQRYQESRRIAYGVAFEEYGSVKSPRLQWRVDADTMTWDEAQSHWIVPRGVRRTIHPNGIVIDTVYKWMAPFTVAHKQIVKLQLNPEEMTFPEFADYITTLKKGGRDTRMQELDLAGQWAFPFVDLIVVLISVPFASIKRRGGMASNIAAAMVLALLYIAFTKIVQAFGAASELPADVVAWSANGVFFLTGIAALWRAR